MLAVAIALASCRHGRPDAPLPEQPKTTLHVTNGEFLDAVIYVVERGQNVRLGTASSNQTTTFVIPPHLIFGATPLSFRVDPVGARAQLPTSELMIDPGDEIELRLSGGRVVLTKRAP